MDSNQIDEGFSRIAHKYDDIVLNKAGYTAHDTISNLLIEAIKVENANVLDLACGTGLSSINFFKKNFQVTGIDIAKGMIEKAKERPFTKLICQDLEKPLQVQDSFYDGAVLIGALTFIHNPLALLKGIKTKLKDNGYLALTVAQKNPLEKELDIHTYTKEEIEEMFLKAGYEIIKVIELFGYEKDGVKVYYFGYLLNIHK